MKVIKCAYHNAMQSCYVEWKRKSPTIVRKGGSFWAVLRQHRLLRLNPIKSSLGSSCNYT